MNLKELYSAIDGDYEGVYGRLMSSDRMVTKFVLKFLSDKSHEALVASMEGGNYEEAFRAAHTMKGVGQNLGFTRLYESASALSEELRGGSPGPDTPALLKQVEEEYQRTVSAIQAFQASAGV